ncbi:MAG: hypothetical protein MUF71_08935 [Candidatus Kapabacteria bacterium]|jgi:hypothetical protein|nr:hypothetical protein [Candidatus Kapabacteria bacterium]
MNSCFGECEITAKKIKKNFPLMNDAFSFLSATLSRTSAEIFSKPDKYLLVGDFFCLVWRIFHGMFIVQMRIYERRSILKNPPETSGCPTMLKLRPHLASTVFFTKLPFGMKNPESLTQ